MARNKAPKGPNNSRRRPAIGAQRAPIHRHPRGNRGSKAGIFLITGAAVVLLSVLGGIFLFRAGQAKPVLGYEVFLGERSLGFVADISTAETAVESVTALRSEEYGLTAVPTQTLQYREGYVLQENLADEAAMTALLQENLQTEAMAAVIRINGHKAAALKTGEEAVQLLQEILESYRKEDAGTTEFTQRVEIVTEPVAFCQISDAQTVKDMLLQSEVSEEYVYQVQPGDTLQQIAREHSMTLEALLQSNPDITEETLLQQGQPLNLSLPARWLNVRQVYEAETEKAVAYQTVTYTDSSMYTTESKVEQEGVDGLSRVLCQYTYLDGALIGEEVVRSEVITPSVDKVITVGTKVKVTSKANGNWGIPLPAGSYRISSQFGMRTLNGTTRMHKGVDMAAPAGTPIYAALDGKVAYSGTATGYGLVIYLDSANGIQTRYAHCSKLLVKAGETVRKGQKIALVGNTGVSTGPHLHFEVRINGEPVNPLK